VRNGGLDRLLAEHPFAVLDEKGTDIRTVQEMPEAFLLSDHQNFTEAEEALTKDAPRYSVGPVCLHADHTITGDLKRDRPEEERMALNEQVEKILAYGECCDHCLGRFFGKRSHGLTNDERGRGLRIARALELNIPYEKPAGTCWICGNFFDAVPEWAQKVAKALEGYEYATFLVGCRVRPLLPRTKEMVWSDLRPHRPGAVQVRR